MASAVKTAPKRRTVKKVNTNQPAYILKQKQLQRIRALMAEQKRQEMMRKQFELFIKQSTFNNNNNNNGYFPALGQKRKTRKVRRQ